ncbi:FHA domain-containing protein [Naasia sp. SYSU D00948]|uniref:FHA domain-containing protein FhaB/FipA n=1 Tax=Naasia sp. SYSU D00948 TaxID=2817379 RepID=UPI001B30ACE6|nr:FHA domain-containing protein [Naasia sp. SYSU D00948]
MSELTLLILRIAFLAVLWAFVFAIVYALRSDLFGSRVKRLQEQPAYAVAPQPSAPPTPPAVQSLPSGPPLPTEGISKPMATTRTASRLVITSGPKAGAEIPLGSEPLTIGRSSESGLQILDDYTSSHHARLLLFGDDWVIQDLDSTNGTFLDGNRVTTPAKVPVNTPVKVGQTTFELRR